MLFAIICGYKLVEEFYVKFYVLFADKLGFIKGVLICYSYIVPVPEIAVYQILNANWADPTEVDSKSKYKFFPWLVVYV